MSDYEMITKSGLRLCLLIYAHCLVDQHPYFIGPYNLHYLLFSGIGALLCHHLFCFPSQSQILFGIGAGLPALLQRKLSRNGAIQHRAQDNGY